MSARASGWVLRKPAAPLGLVRRVQVPSKKTRLGSSYPEEQSMTFPLDALLRRIGDVPAEPQPIGIGQNPLEGRGQDKAVVAIATAVACTYRRLKNFQVESAAPAIASGCRDQAKRLEVMVQKPCEGSRSEAKQHNDQLAGNIPGFHEPGAEFAGLSSSLEIIA